MLAISIALLLGSTACEAEQDSTKPLFKNSVVATDIDFITTADPSAFKSIRFVGRETKEMPDKRSEELMAEGTFVFEASFKDGDTVPIWLHPDFGSQSSAKKYADILSGPLGRLPAFMRRKLTRVVVHRGDESAFGESEGHFFVLYSENMETRVRNHDLEETVFHESVHAALDAKHLSTDAWKAAQKADGVFLTEYGERNPGKEDLAETALFVRTMQKHPGRLPANVEAWITKHLPSRVAYIKGIFAQSDQ